VAQVRGCCVGEVLRPESVYTHSQSKYYLREAERSLEQKGAIVRKGRTYKCGIYYEPPNEIA
jgi:hypothetical protein